MSGRGTAQGHESLRQAMSWLHTWAGLLLGWVLYAVLWTGTLAYYRAEITAWMQPELPVVAALPEAGQAAAVAQAYMTRHHADSPRWTLVLPTPREPRITLAYEEAAPVAGQPGFGTALLHPVTGALLTPRSTRGGDFFYRFHYELQLAYPWGRWIAGVAAMFMLVAVVSGVIVHRKLFQDFFVFRPSRVRPGRVRPGRGGSDGSRQLVASLRGATSSGSGTKVGDAGRREATRRGGGARAWMDGHNVLAVLGLPFHLMISFTGLILLMSMLMPAGILAAYDDTRHFTAQLVPGHRAPPASGVASPLMPLQSMVERAEAQWDGRAGRVTVLHAGDAAATVVVQRLAAERVSHSLVPPALAYEGATGRPIGDPKDRSPALVAVGGLIGLHLGWFAEPMLRALYFLIGMASTAMVATGLILWLAKRRQKGARASPTSLPDASPSLRLVNALNIATIAGLPLATAAYFWANRLLPADLPTRAAWEVRAFFIAWLAACAWTLIARRNRWRDLLGASALLLMGLPLLNAFTASHLIATMAQGDGVRAGFEMICIGGGAVLGWIGYRSGQT
ncbi:peptidase [Bordetella genomosp. 5]|uniref:PepSY-associated TM helix domain-containing protein n=1 Tax=Bordetella genomosp. 5 TaxID=1395608 RepID=UPI000B9ED45F|nr:PepSY-associated TM helix domain-containing protein [Bordetella genomosp. 5]OZI46307.1 peptidase [Bordetella genomosp. 5]